MVSDLLWWNHCLTILAIVSFKSCSLVGVILYDNLDIGVMRKDNSMLSFNSFSCVNPRRLSRNTSENSYTTRVSLTPETVSYVLFTMCAKNAVYLLLNFFLTLTLLIIILRIRPFQNMKSLPLYNLNLTLFFLLLISTPYRLKKFIPIIT